jgi:hypothetical protein
MDLSNIAAQGDVGRFRGFGLVLIRQNTGQWRSRNRP